MTKNIKNIAFTFFLALFLSVTGAGLMAATPINHLSGKSKKVESVESTTATTTVRKAKSIEHIKQGDDFFMEMNSWMRGDLEIQVYDIDGNLVQAANTHVGGQDNTLKFKAQDLDKGFYKIKVYTKARVQKKNIVIDWYVVSPVAHGTKG